MIDVDNTMISFSKELKELTEKLSSYARRPLNKQLEMK